MNPIPHPPRFCQPLHAHWPLPQAVAGAQLVSCHFDPAQLQHDDAALSGIAAVRGANKRQAEYLAGRLCARQALLQLTGAASVPAVGADRAPCWPAGVVGSITHGDGWAAAVVASAGDYQGLGLDVETWLSHERAERLAAQLLTPAELLRLAQLPDEQHAAQISLSFSLKESLFKALYPLVQQRFYFHDAQILSAADGQAELQLLRDLGPHWPAGSRCQGQFADLGKQVLSLVSIGA
ncbi:4'-phosphopantetheinyl transferase family protein [Pseudomonas sp.]|uniref:4'-phosphopantetheinyl transferase family protein n=1 Tax=Pseudomonas sp. TaxID=306 RepID=UPI003BB7D88B